jgi:mono/diheme cytochrome c family protein
MRQLPSGSWQRLIAQLDQHFGVDASLDPKTANEVGAWLKAHAGTYKRVGAQDKPEQDRISKSAWFVRKHREVVSSIWSRPSIKSAANCTACHGPGATHGVFEEDLVRIPK